MNGRKTSPEGRQNETGEPRPGTFSQTDDYRDLLDLPHHTSPRHPRMAEEMRAAQFAPFAALTGYEETIEETALRQRAEVYARDRMKD